jgi:hypothetical protein
MSDKVTETMGTAHDVAKWLRSVDADRIISGHQLGGQPGHCICGISMSGRRRWRRTLAGHLFDVLADEIEGRAPRVPKQRRRGETP